MDMAVLLVMVLPELTCTEPVVAVKETPAPVPALTNCGELPVVEPERVRPVEPNTLMAPPVVLIVPLACNEGSVKVSLPALDRTAVDPGAKPTCKGCNEMILALVPAVPNCIVPST